MTANLTLQDSLHQKKTLGTPRRNLLETCVDPNDSVFACFTAPQRQNIGNHTCLGGDYDSAHSHEVPFLK